MMEFPKEFPRESRAAVLAERLRAGKELKQDSIHTREREEQLQKYVLRRLVVFVKEASKLSKTWPADQIERAALEFLRRTTIHAIYDQGRGVGELWISRTTGQLTSGICREFEKRPEWKAYEELLLEIAETQAPPAASEPTRGYRAEIKAWMIREGLTTLDQAAWRLKIDKSALKSIQSSRGKRRCGQETLDRVLKAIGVDPA